MSLVALVIGVLWGAVAGYLGGRSDAVMMRIVDILYALPFIIFIILLMVVFGRSMLLLFLAIGAVEWLTMARIVRGQVLGIRRQEYIEAALSMGLSTWTILRRHVIPNTLSPVIVYATTLVGLMIVVGSGLSFLGLGVQPPDADWGAMVSDGRIVLKKAPHATIFPGLTIVLVALAFNFVGDGLRDALDPKTVARKLGS